ncbi:MAG: hypothetical protein SGJ04_02665 [Bacteroidota bacterium]|nr:hypothetical protein [Bacteroidota bacterium]
MKSVLKYIHISLIVLLFTCLSVSTSAQCPMCKHNVESSLRKDSTKKVGSGLNSGIVVLLSMPYIAFASIGFLWYRNSRANKNK